MCTYATDRIDVTGSGKGTQTWLRLTDATVYLDHPQHAFADHTLNVDFRNRWEGPSARVAVELTEDSARRLAEAILRTLASVPASENPCGAR